MKPTAKSEVMNTDILIIGSGMGGSTMAWALRNSGVDVLVVERGEHLPQEPQNSDPREMHLKKRYRNSEEWTDGVTGRRFHPGVYYWVGGNTKFFGAALPRFRESDFQEVIHAEGISPAWPFSYADLEPYYQLAEELFQVHGDPTGDPTEPPRSKPYPHERIEHEPEIARFAESLRSQGLHPFHAAGAMQFKNFEDRRRATASDGQPDEFGLKSDAENRALKPALESGKVRLETGIYVKQLVREGERVVAALAERGGPGGAPIRIEANKFVLAAGAANSAALLLRSADDRFPDGLANSSGLLGRNYMVHNSTFFIGVNPRRENPTKWQKTLGMNDWYEAGPGTPYPLGNMQMLGKLQAPMIKQARAWVPNFVLEQMARRSLDIYLTTEDLPRLENRVRIGPRGIIIDWTPNNLKPHAELVDRMKKVVRKAGYPLIFTERMGIETNSHMCGTAVAGEDPKTSVLTANCRTHDLDNLWLADSSFFPSSAALNPALTIAANAIRISSDVIA